MKQINSHANSASLFAILMVCLFANPFFVGQADNISNKHSLLAIKLQAEKPIPAAEKVVLHGRVDMLSDAYKEAGLTLSSNTFPSTVKIVLVGSPAYYADIRATDKVLSANFKENRLCLSINRAGTPYYTEIRLASEINKPFAPAASNANNTSLLGFKSQTVGQMIAIGFRFYNDTRKVNYVDPKSDLFGKVHVGDVYPLLNDSVIPIVNTSRDFGTVAYPIFLQNGVLRCYTCRRKPIESFAPDMAQRFRTGFGAVYIP